jgi:hypothetical protein
MSFVEFLQGIGDRLGILEAVSSADAGQEIIIRTRIVTLQELASEIKCEEVHALADSPAELSIPFEKIYETAGISSNPKDWTIERLRQWIASEPFKNNAREEIQKAILNHLSSDGVPIETIVKDAIARDQALDSFEACIKEKMKHRRELCGRKMSEIEAQIKALQEQSLRLADKLEDDEKKWLEWRKQKRARERDLASVASYIVDHPIITTDDENAE